MATLVSAGVSVTIIDESFFIPVSAPTVPLFFIATQANKKQPDGVSTAEYTNEHSVVRTITSIGQLTQSYGVPAFRTAEADATLPVSQRRQLHGDARNEYGLMAMTQFLGIGNLCFAVRANVDLADKPLTAVVAGDATFTSVSGASELPKGALGSFAVKATNKTAEIWNLTCVDNTDGAVFSVTGSVSGVADLQATAGAAYDNGMISFTIANGETAFEVGDNFEVQLVESTVGSELGANDAAKRVAIVTALQAEINSNQEVRSETYEYNLILCPGYHEVVDEMLALSQSINDEAFVIADTPFDKNADDVALWGKTTARKNSSSVAYYYPHALASNLDGIDVFVASSGVALRTIAYSDSVAELWFAPAGVRRGLVTGISTTGYVTGTLGTPTKFVEVNLNQGQRDNLYQYYTNINPIAYFPGRGFVVFGQKTSAPAASSLDRINVARLLMYIKRALRKGAFPFLFEPNDQITRDNLKASVDGFLGDILVKRGLYDFVTLCDASNNTPTRIDRNELWCDVALKPVKAAEFIYIPVRVLSTGAKMP